MFERFTHDARTAVVLAQEEARDAGADHLGSEHLLYGVLRDRDAAPALVLARWGVGAATVASAARTAYQLDDEALSALGIDLDEVRRRTEASFGSGALDRPSRRWGRGRRLAKGHLPFTDGARLALSQAVQAAAFHRYPEIGSAQLFLGLLSDDGTTRRVLHRLGVTASTEELTTLIRAELDQAA